MAATYWSSLSELLTGQQGSAGISAGADERRLRRETRYGDRVANGQWRLCRVPGLVEDLIQNKVNVIVVDTTLVSSYLPHSLRVQANP